MLQGRPWHVADRMLILWVFLLRNQNVSTIHLQAYVDESRESDFSITRKILVRIHQIEPFDGVELFDAIEQGFLDSCDISLIVHIEPPCSVASEQILLTTRARYSLSLIRQRITRRTNRPACQYFF